MSGSKKRKNDIQEVLEFWKSVMDDDEINIQHRLKASELCLKLSEDQKEGEEHQVIIYGEKGIED